MRGQNGVWWLLLLDTGFISTLRSSIIIIVNIQVVVCANDAAKNLFVLATMSQVVEDVFGHILG